MITEPPQTIINKRMSFLSVIVLCITFVVITLIVSAAGVGIYSLRILDKKSDGLVQFVGQLAEKLPQIRDSLPPVVLDAIDDERRPDYIDQLRVKVKLVHDEGKRWASRAAVEIENKGDETISLLTMRIVMLDADGQPLGERQTWAASPLQLDGEWRGPLLPRETRRLALRCADSDDVASLSHEITDIRIWCKYDESQDNDNKRVVALRPKSARFLVRN
jgi:hypothetical protein